MQEKRMGENGQNGRGTVVSGPGDVTPRTGSPRWAQERGTAARLRLRHLRKQVLAVAVAAAAAAGGTTALLMASASHPPTALATVASALASTSADSYSFSLHSTVRFRGSVVHSDVVSGAYDPRHELGTELLATRTPRGARVRMQIRFIRRYVYSQKLPGSGFRKPWNESPVPSAGADAMPGNDVYGFVTDQPVTPAELSGVLRSAGTLREVGPASGQGWTGIRYAFTARFPGARESVSGTVDIDQQGRVRRLVTITRQGVQGRITTNRDLTFGDFGAPVPVTVPPASQVGYTSRPYSGFLF